MAEWINFSPAERSKGAECLHAQALSPRLESLWSVWAAGVRIPLPAPEINHNLNGEVNE